MRILTPLHGFDPGGVERVALRLNRVWRERAIDAVIGIARPKTADATDCFSLGRGGYRFARLETLWMMWRLPFAVRRYRPDILFCPGNTYTAAAALIGLLFGRHGPVIVAKISNDLERRDMPPLGRWWYRRWLWLQGRLIDHFVGIAEPMRAEITAAMRVPNSRIHVINDPALDAADYARLSALPERDRPGPGRRFVAIGRLVPQKNFAQLLEAFAAARGPEDRLTLFGDGPLRDDLARRIIELELGNHVILAGHQGCHVTMLGEADALLLSSLYEGVPSVVIEALAAGLPVIATDCCVSMAALLRDGLGTIVPPASVEALAAALAAFRPGGHDRAAARRRAAAFTLEDGASAYLDLFAQLAAERMQPMRRSIADGELLEA